MKREQEPSPLLDYELVALLHKHFGFDPLYMEHEIEWDSFYIHLAVALDLDERGDYFKYVLAGGDPKKWRWRSSDKAGTRKRGSVFRRIVEQFRGRAIVEKVDKVAGGEFVKSVVAVKDPESGEVVKHISRKDMWRVRVGEITIDQAEAVDMEGRVFKQRS